MQGIISRPFLVTVTSKCSSGPGDLAPWAFLLVLFFPARYFLVAFVLIAKAIPC